MRHERPPPPPPQTRRIVAELLASGASELARSCLNIASSMERVRARARLVSALGQALAGRPSSCASSWWLESSLASPQKQPNDTSTSSGSSIAAINSWPFGMKCGLCKLRLPVLPIFHLALIIGQVALVVSKLGVCWDELDEAGAIAESGISAPAGDAIVVVQQSSLACRKCID